MRNVDGMVEHIELGRALRAVSIALESKNAGSTFGLTNGACDVNPQKVVDALNLLGLLSELELDSDVTNFVCGTLFDDIIGAPPAFGVARKRATGGYVVLAGNAVMPTIEHCMRALEKLGVKGVTEFVFFGRQNGDMPKTYRGNTRAADGRAWQRHGRRYVQAIDILVYVESMLGKESLAPGDVREAAALLRESVVGNTDAPERLHALLVGNGLNLLEPKNLSMSWTNVLKRLAHQHLQPANHIDADTMMSDGTIPSPLKFELLASYASTDSAFLGSARSSRHPFSDLKSSLANIMRGTSKSPGMEPIPSVIEQEIVGLPLDCLLTTNYDKNLENCYVHTGGSLREESFSPNAKYLMRRTGTVLGTAGTDFFHVHGIESSNGRDLSSSICIGYEHYMGYVHHLRGRLTRGGTSHGGTSLVDYLTLDAIPLSGEWYELFFVGDMAIVGLSMAYEEADLWELLTLRAAARNKLMMRGVPKEQLSSHITFFDIEQGNEFASPWIDGQYRLRPTFPIDNPSELQRHNSHNQRSGQSRVLDRYHELTGLDVNVRVVHTSEYGDGCLTIFDYLRSHWS